MWKTDHGCDLMLISCFVRRGFKSIRVTEIGIMRHVLWTERKKALNRLLILVIILTPSYNTCIHSLCVLLSNFWKLDTTKYFNPIMPSPTNNFLPIP